MKRPVLDSFVSYRILPVDVLARLRNKFDDDSILAYVLYRLFDKPKQSILKQYQLQKKDD